MKNIGYIRVSNEERAKSGYSADDQKRDISSWASANRIKIDEFVIDAGWSGEILERPGLDKIRRFSQNKELGTLVVKYRDRLARGAYAQLLQKEFQENSARFVALNAQTEDTPEGELQGGILDSFSAFELSKIRQRCMGGKDQKARQGKVIASPQGPKYGFALSDCRDYYVVDEEKMRVVRRIFEMVAAGSSLNAVKTALELEGVPAPKGKYWSRQFLRKTILSDAYRPHTKEEVLSHTDPLVLDVTEEPFGVLWYGKDRTTRKVVLKDGEYKYKQIKTPQPKENWTAIPLPDAGIPLEVVSAARERIEGNQRQPRADMRGWELSSAMLKCAHCGKGMGTKSSKTMKHGTTYRYFYYRCLTHYSYGNPACDHHSYHKASRVEEKIWNEVYSLLSEPERWERMINLLVEEETNGPDPIKEAKSWSERLKGLNQKRSSFQDQQAEGLITMPELADKLKDLDGQREKAQEELDKVKDRAERISALKQSAKEMHSRYSQLAREGLEVVNAEDKRQIYSLLEMKAYVDSDENIEITGKVGFCQDRTSIR